MSEKLKTLKDFGNPCMKCGSVECAVCSEDLRQAAREWINELKKQQKLHAEFICNGIGENPSFDEPEGFSFSDCHSFPFGYDEIIDWIKHFFNLED